MCGIAGIFNLNNKPLSKETLIRFTDSMYHRGPDGAGYELLESDTLGLGHRRLSILDLSVLGKQPMSYADKKYWITYNGEVFNFFEIKNELIAIGFTFKTETDTEVILAAYIQWGEKCLDKFNGMFAFAIWNESDKELFLARDRFGIKPLYYNFKNNNVFAFASETRAFKFLDGFERSFDDNLLQQNIADPYALEGIGYTIFSGIYQLLPGHYIKLKSHQEVKQIRWWHINNYLSNNYPTTLNQQAEKFYELFRDACKIRLISDVPVASALSGGLDSTAVYSTVFDILKNESLGRINKNSQQAFTAIFPDLPQNEKEYAQKAANYMGGKINYIEINESELANKIETETEIADFIGNSPLASISAVYAGMRNAGITVSMDGHGVDEMLFGYKNMVYDMYNDSLWNGKSKDALSYANVLTNMYHSDNFDNAKNKFLKDIDEKDIRDKKIISKIKNVLKNNKKNNLYQPINLPSLSNSPYNFSDYPLNERMLYNQFFQHTLPALLRNFDRAGMINSVEIRMPFMDWRLVSYIFSLPTSSKLGNGFTKLILREAMKGKMEESLRTRTYKVGIASPLEHWFSGILKDWVMDSVKDSNLNSELFLAYKNNNMNKALVQKAWTAINLELIK